jgi:hypothetical protein
LNELLDATYFFFGVDFWVSALPAADFESLEVRPSRSVFDAAFAAADDVVFSGALRWDSALPAADLEALPVEELDRVFDPLRAAGLEVTSFLAMQLSCGV